MVIGKFFASFILILIALAFTLPYAITLASIGNLDSGEVICGYLGLSLISAAYISIGLYASSITSNQIVAFLASLFIGLFFHIIFDVLSSNFTGIVGEVLNTLSMSTHFESISRGVIDSKDIFFFLSIVFLGIVLSESSLSKRKVSG